MKTTLVEQAKQLVSAEFNPEIINGELVITYPDNGQKHHFFQERNNETRLTDNAEYYLPEEINTYLIAVMKDRAEWKTVTYFDLTELVGKKIAFRYNDYDCGCILEEGILTRVALKGVDTKHQYTIELDNRRVIAYPYSWFRSSRLMAGDNSDNLEVKVF